MSDLYLVPQNWVELAETSPDEALRYLLEHPQEFGCITGIGDPPPNPTLEAARRFWQGT